MDQYVLNERLRLVRKLYPKFSWSVEENKIVFADENSACTIAHPYWSICGRFMVDPMVEYGVEPDLAALMALWQGMDP